MNKLGLFQDCKLGSTLKNNINYQVSNLKGEKPYHLNRYQQNKAKKCPIKFVVTPVRNT
jgi:hypothetical protein